MATKITRALSSRNPAWTAAWAELECAIEALDEARVGAATTEWLRCAGAVADRLPVFEQDSNYFSTKPSEADLQLVWEELHALMQTATTLTAKTLQPNALERATACTTALCDALLSGFKNKKWETDWEDGGTYGDDWCTVGLKGAPGPTLRLHLTRYAVYSGWCYRHDTMWKDILSSESWDSLPRVLERVLLFFASLCKFDTVLDCLWGDLAELSANMNHLAYDNTEDLLRMLIDGSDTEGWDLENGIEDPGVRAMLVGMLAARNAGNWLRLPLSAHHLDLLTYRTGMHYIEQAKKAHYRGLWRKWWLQWTCVSRWTTAVGERHGAIGGIIGAAAVADYDVDMGTA